MGLEGLDIQGSYAVRDGHACSRFASWFHRRSSFGSSTRMINPEGRGGVRSQAMYLPTQSLSIYTILAVAEAVD